MTGIITYGALHPPVSDPARGDRPGLGRNDTDVTGGLGVREKSLPDVDEDTATIAVEAARHALARREIDPAEIGAVYVGSESHPVHGQADCVHGRRGDRGDPEHDRGRL